MAKGQKYTKDMLERLQAAMQDTSAVASAGTETVVDAITLIEHLNERDLVIINARKVDADDSEINEGIAGHPVGCSCNQCMYVRRTR